ncbi:hypothetical protein [Priestia megaterium]|uniref:hypothetical protein n=1 Tax=Priestia megaterium TaxID=1404 RepID=UPI002877C727|nr:hypothetical protein [Priestia megaterium]
MSEIYTCSVDNRQFNSKESLIEHLLKNYSITDTKNGGTSEILKTLQEAFPFAMIEVSELDDKQYGEYNVNMYWKEYESDFTFSIGETTNTYSDTTNFETVEQSITYHKRFLENKDEIIKLLEEKYSPEKIIITQMFDGGLYDSDIISFQMIKDQQDYYGRYEFDGVEKFADSFKGYFASVIEGDVVKESDHYNGYDKEVTVDGVPISRLLDRAKRIRIEILEEK